MLTLVLAVAATALAQAVPAAARFEAVDVYVDSGQSALAAYQFELTVASGNATIVGVEGGEHAAFASAPYYDPAALAGGRIIISALSTGSELPAGRTRVARVHMRVEGTAEYGAALTVAGDAAGQAIEAGIETEGAQAQ